jgi:hypothetical protein
LGLCPCAGRSASRKQGRGSVEAAGDGRGRADGPAEGAVRRCRRAPRTATTSGRDGAPAVGGVARERERMREGDRGRVKGEGESSVDFYREGEG